jgi:hypothetical protein
MGMMLVVVIDPEREHLQHGCGIWPVLSQSPRPRQARVGNTAPHNRYRSIVDLERHLQVLSRVAPFAAARTS